MTQVRSIPAPSALAAGVLAALAAGGLAAQAPLPEPKPIVVRPLPQPGAPRPRPVEPSKPAPAEATKPAATPAAPSASPAPARATATYGTTPVPWPAGGSDPAHFPAGIPRVPGAWREAYSFGPLTASAWFHCGSPPARVARDYEAFLAREKWDLVPIPGPPPLEERVVIARKGDWSLRVDAAPHPRGGTEVFVAASLKPLAPPPGAKGKGGRP